MRKEEGDDAFAAFRFRAGVVVEVHALEHELSQDVGGGGHGLAHLDADMVSLHTFDFARGPPGSRDDVTHERVDALRVTLAQHFVHLAG